MIIPFSLPLIDDPVIAETMDCLTRTGWLTSGPKVRELEAEISLITGTPVLAVNSWSSGAMLMLKWYGVGPGDEVIVPAYTYCATALCALQLGAKVVMVDVLDDFTINPQAVAAAITPRTKAIIPVDLGGLPCHYKALRAVVESHATTAQFQPGSERQRKLGRPLLMADAAHSIGSSYGGMPAGQLCDVTVFSMHSVKNITTGEGGAICLNLPSPFDNVAQHLLLRALALNGQSKSAFEKNIPGAWRYDIQEFGMKVNLPDICAAVGLAQIRRYLGELLPDRRRLVGHYQAAFSDCDWAICPILEDTDRVSSYHLYLLRIKDFDEAARDLLIQEIAETGIGVNVHYIPMPMLTAFRNLGYDIADYPVTYDLYCNEISLPVYNGLSIAHLDAVVQAVKEGYEKVRKSIEKFVPSVMQPLQDIQTHVA